MNEAKLLVLRPDIAVIVEHLASGSRLPTIKLIGNLPSFAGTVTLMGTGWTMYVTVLHRDVIVDDLRFFGDEDRFDEDFLVSKMSI